MKRLTITLLATIVLGQLASSQAAPSENLAARDLATAKSFAFGGIGVAGLMSQGERICELFWRCPMPRSSYKLHSHMPRRQASSTSWWACAGVIVLRIKKSLVRWRVPMMTLK